MSPRSFFALLPLLLVFAAACSDDDGGGEGAACGPQTCIGCCQGGTCNAGTTPASCGASGQPCQACPSGYAYEYGQCTKSTTCGPANCSTGCCQAGQCVLGSSHTACGTSGSNCQNCTATGKTCKDGFCSGGSSSCGPANCTGCCKAGKCLTGTTSSVCGKGGSVCLNCATSGKTCDATKGVCSGGGSTCNASSCSGCCKDNKCFPGNSASACGKNAASCLDCSASGKSCDSSTGACQGGGSCNASTCKTGCCKGGQCHPGNSDSACGTNASACSDCSALGKTCDNITRLCKGGSGSCGPTSCSGCCKNQNCFPGNTASACGKNAASCVDCSASGKTCDSSTGACKGGSTTCDSSNCTGCCDGNKCEQGYNSSACGKNGATCSQCKAWETCLSKACTPSAFSNFELTAVSATIAQTKTWDPIALFSYRNPDPFIGLKLGSSGCSGYYVTCSKTIKDTYTPSWNQSLGKFSGTYIKYPCLTIRDEDSTTSGVSCPTGYDIIGECLLTITNADIAAGTKTITSCANPKDGKNYITKLTIGIKHLP